MSSYSAVVVTVNTASDTAVDRVAEALNRFAETHERSAAFAAPVDCSEGFLTVFTGHVNHLDTDVLLAALKGAVDIDASVNVLVANEYGRTTNHYELIGSNL